MERFLTELKSEEARIGAILNDPKPLRLTREEEQEFRKAESCSICNKSFDDPSNPPVRDHCHVTGKFRGASHKRCNLQYRLGTRIPVVLHNLKGYDSHHIIKSLRDPDLKLKCVPNNMERYMAFQIDRLMFIDSFQFMATSLESLVLNLLKKGVEPFGNCQTEFQTPEKLELMLHQGIYPYSHMNAWARFDEEELPPIEAFHDDLNDEALKEKDYEHAKRVWEAFELKNLGEYHDLYLKSDVLLLADVFEAFRSISLQHYGLDPCHYFTAPGLSWDALLKSTGCELDLLDNVDDYQFFEKGIRGGVCQISHRYAKANNPYMQSYDPSQDLSYIAYLDANNLYESTPPNKWFRWLEEQEIAGFTEESIKKIPDDSPVGYWFVVDLDYPSELHDAHNDYPLCPERMVVRNELLSAHQLEQQQAMRIRADVVEKLVPNLSPKSNYQSLVAAARILVLNST